MSIRYPSNDSELREAVRAETLYEESPDELPEDKLADICERAKARTELETGSSDWYTDNGLGFALVAYASIRAKSAMENFAIASYTLGDEVIQTRNADPEDSQQVQQWADDVRTGLDASDATTANDAAPANTADYVGGDYYYE